MECDNCGNAISPDYNYCRSCGKAQSKFSKVKGITKRVTHLTKRSVVKIRDKFDKKISSYIQALSTEDDPRIAGVTVPKSKKSAVEKALYSFQAKFLDSKPLYQIEYEKWEKNLSKRMEDNVCIVCLIKWKQDDDVAICPSCQSGGHLKHMKTWIQENHSCPLCRQPLETVDLVEITFT